MADAIKTGRTPRCSGELAYHVLEVMTGILESPLRDQFMAIESRPPMPDRLPETFTVI